MRIIAAILVSCLVSTAASPARASSSEWADAEGARIRLVTAGPVDDEGNLRGALQVQLEPGWKTYWRDPGSAGVPPQIDLSTSPHAVSGELGFPVPQRFNDDAGHWAGYKHPVAFPVRFRFDSPAETGEIEARIFLGVCRDICIPVQATLRVDPASEPESPSDEALVAAAHLAWPQPSRPDFNVSPRQAVADKVELEARSPAGTTATDLFLAGENGFVFGAPERKQTGGTVVFEVPVLERPRKGNPPVFYTLVSDRGAVQGTVQLP